MKSYKKAVLKRAKKSLQDQGVPHSEIALIIMDMEHSAERRWHNALHRSAFHLVALGKMTMRWDRQEKSVIWQLLPGGEILKCLVCGLEEPLAHDRPNWVREWWADPQLGVIGDQEVCIACAQGLFATAPDGRACLRPELVYDPVEHLINVRK